MALRARDRAGLRPETAIHLMTLTATRISRGIFAAVTVVLLVVTFYFPMIGLGYALDSSAERDSRIFAGGAAPSDW